MAHRIVMGPMDESAEIIPLVHAPKRQPIAQADRDAISKVDVVCDQQRIATAKLQDKALVS